MTFIDPNDPKEVVKHPYSIVTPQRGGDAVVGLMTMLRNDGVKCFIAGGFARWVLSPNDTTPCPGDIDIYFQDEPSYSMAKFVLGKEGFKIALETNNALTLNPPNSAEFDEPLNIQLIKPSNNRQGSVYDVLDAFDLNICQAALVIKDDNTLKGYVSQGFNWGEANQRMHILNISSPLATLQRCMKYAGRGYKISSKNLMKVFIEWDGRSADERTRIRNLMESGGFKELYDLLDK